MLSLAHALMSRLYLEAKAQPRSFHYTYPMEREMYRYIEPSQLEITKEPAYLPALVGLLHEHFDIGSGMWDIFEMLHQDGHYFEVTQSRMRTLTIYGPVDYTIYVDVLHDTHKYILRRLEYYTGIPLANIQLLSSGTVVDDISAGKLFEHAIPSSTLSYIILPYTLPVTVPANYVPLPPTPLDFSDCCEELEPLTPSLLDIDYEGVD